MNFIKLNMNKMKEEKLEMKKLKGIFKKIQIGCKR